MGGSGGSGRDGSGWGGSDIFFLRKVFVSDGGGVCRGRLWAGGR